MRTSSTLKKSNWIHELSTANVPVFTVKSCYDNLDCAGNSYRKNCVNRSCVTDEDARISSDIKNIRKGHRDIIEKKLRYPYLSSGTIDNRIDNIHKRYTPYGSVSARYTPNQMELNVYTL